MADAIIPFGGEIKLRGLEAFLSGIERARKKTNRFNKAQKQIKQVGIAVGRVARHGVRLVGTMAKVSGAVAGVGALAIREFGQFEMSVARIQTLLEPGVSAMEQFGDQIQRNSVRFGQAAEDTSNAVFQAISAGIDASKESVSSFSDVVGEAATGGFTRMETVVDGLTTVMNTYGLSVDEARNVSDAFFVANKLGKTTFEELSASIGRAAPTAKALGVSYEELLAATVGLTKAGISTSETMSSLKAAFANIAKPSKEAQDAAKDLGIDFSIAALKSKGLAGFLEELTKKAGGSAEAQTALFGSVEAFNAIAQLTSETGLKDFHIAMASLENRSGATKKAFEDVASTTGFKLRQITQGLKRFVVEAGGGLVEGLGLDKIGNIPEAIERTARGVREGAKAFAEGFKQAFAPFSEATEFNWTQFAADLGKAAGSITSAFLKVGKVFAEMVAKFSPFLSKIVSFVEFMTGADPAAAARKRAGIKGDFTNRLEVEKNRIRNEYGFGPLGVSLPDETITQIARERLRKKEVEVGAAILAGGGTTTAAFKGAAGMTHGTGADAAAVVRSRRQKATEAGRITNPIVSFGKSLLGAKQDLASGIATNLKNGLKTIVNVSVDNKVNFKDRQGGSKKKNFNASGRGGAELKSTIESGYVLLEDQVVPISDEYAFFHFFNESRA